MRRWLLFGLLLSAVTWVPGARGAVRITGRSIEISSSTGARTVVDRSPFRLSFYDRHGRRVLAESPGGALLVAPPAAQSEFGVIGPPRHALYAPLSFLVGCT